MENGRIVQENPDGDRLLRIDDIPELQAEISPSDAPPSAIGRLWLALAAVTVLLGGSAPAQATQTEDSDSSYRAGPCRTLLLEAWSHVDSMYWDRAFVEREWGAARTAIPALDCEGEDGGAVRELLGRVGDPAVRWVDPTGLAALIRDFQGRPASGVGLLEILSVDIDERSGLLTVVTPIPGGPAARAGVRSGDVIERIDGVRSDTLDLGVAASLLRGHPGTRVTLRIRRGREIFEVQLRREELDAIEPVAAAFHGEPEPIGYVRILQFVPGTAEAVASALERLEERGASGWILDLRDNPGGLVQELVRTAELFLAAERPIARLSSRPGGDTTFVTASDARTDLPIAILVNRGSASAAEALAGALQDHGRATLLGERTFGKGLAHNVLPLADGSAVLVPNARLRTPAGRDVLSRAIEPDVLIDSPNLAEAGPAGPGDPLVDRALEHLRQVSAGGAQAADRDAEDAVREVQHGFFAALSDGDSARAISYLHPELIVYEGGHAETLEQYRSGHLGADMAFLADVERNTTRERLEIRGETGLYLAEYTMKGRYGDREIDLHGTETLLLVHTGDGWKIRHIHWSSR